MTLIVHSKKAEWLIELKDNKNAQDASISCLQ